MLMGFEGEERALEFVGFTTEGEEEEEEVSGVLASSPASSWPSWGASIGKESVFEIRIDQNLRGAVQVNIVNERTCRNE